MSTTLVVMAAGRGSRFGGMKQIAALGPSGESLFDYGVYDAVRAGFDDVVFVVSEESRGPVQAHVEAGCGRHVPVRYVLQSAEGRPKPYGTGHAVLCVCQAVDGAFGVINADDFYGARSFELLADGLAKYPEDHLMVAFRLSESLSTNGGVSRGLTEVEDGMLTSIVELHEVEDVDGAIRCKEGVALTGDELISANLWGFQPSFCATLAAGFEEFLLASGDDPKAEFLIGDGIARLAMAGLRGPNAMAGQRGPGVRVVPTPEPFSGVTYAEDVAELRGQLAALVEEGRYPTPLWP